MKLILSLCTFLLCVNIVLCQSESTAPTKRILVELSAGPKGGYRIDGKDTATVDVVDVLTKKLLAHGRAVPVVVLIDGKCPIEDVFNAKGIIRKVGFQKARYFHCPSERRMMLELNLSGTPVPYSTNPE